MRTLALTLFLTVTYLNVQAQCVGFVVENTGLAGITRCDKQDLSITIRNASTVDIDTFTIQLNCEGSPVVSRTFNGVNVAVGATYTTVLTVPVSIASGSCNLNPVVTAVCNGIPVRRLGTRTNYRLVRNQATLSTIDISSAAPLSALAQRVDYSVLIRNTGPDTASRITPTLSFAGGGSTTLVPASVKYKGLAAPPDLPPDSTMLIEWSGNIANCPTAYHDWNLALRYQHNCTGNTSTLNVTNRANTPVTYYSVADVAMTATANVGEICIDIGRASQLNVDQNNPKITFEGVLPNWLLWNRTVNPILRLSGGTVINPATTTYNSTTGNLAFSFNYPSADLLTGAEICIGGLVPDCRDSTTHFSEEFHITGINVFPDNRLSTCSYPVYLDASSSTTRSFLNRLNANLFDFTICGAAPSTLLSHRAFRLNIGETPPACVPDRNLLILNDTFRTITQVRIRRDNIKAAYAAVYFRRGAFFGSGTPLSIATFLRPAAIRFSINDNDAGVTYVCTNVQFNNIEFAGASTQAGYEFILNLDSLRGGGCAIPAGFDFDTDDRLELTVDYVVLQNVSMRMSHLQTLYATNAGLPYFDNRTILSTPRLLSFEVVQNPITAPGVDRLLCDNRFYGSEFSVQWDGGLAPANPFNCEQRSIFSYEIDLTRSSLNPFSLDSLDVRLNAKSKRVAVPSSGSLNVSNLFQTGVLDSVDIIGNTLTLTGLEPYNCSAPFIDPINWNYSLRTTGTLSLRGSASKVSRSLNQILDANYPTNLNVANGGLTYTEKQFIWNVNVVSPVAASFHNQATQFFLDIETDPRITIDSVLDITSPVGCGVGKLSKDATNYYPIILGDCGAGNTKRYQVYGSSTTCFTTTINANVRFRCNARTTGALIAADNDTPLAPCLIDRTSQAVQTGSSLTVRDARATPRIVNFCDRPNVQLNITNTSLNVSNKVSLRLPIKKGLRLNDSSITFTPSAFVTPLPTLTRRVNRPNTGVRMVNDTLIIAIDTIVNAMGVSGITSGATLAVSFDLALTCDFKSGENLEGTLNYFQFCSPAGAGISTIFNTHRIYTKQYSSRLGLVMTEAPRCSGEFNIQASVGIQGISTPGTTNTEDSIRVTMPVGTTYLAGSSTAAWGEPRVVGNDLIWGVPATPYTTTSVATVNLSFKTRAGQAAADLCRTHIYTGQVYYPQGGVCPSGLLCPGGNILLDTAVARLTIDRPTLEIKDVYIQDITSITAGLFINDSLENSSGKDAPTRSLTYRAGSRTANFNVTVDPIRAGEAKTSNANLPALLDQLSLTGRLDYLIDRSLPLNCLCKSDSTNYLFSISRDTTEACLGGSATIGVPFTAPAGTTFKWLLPTGFCCISDSNIPNPTVTPNLRGNFTLYRIARSGGKVTAIHREEIVIANTPLNISEDTLKVCAGDSVNVVDRAFTTAADYNSYDYRWRINGILQPASDTLSFLKRLLSLAGSPYQVVLEKTLTTAGCSIFDTVIVQIIPLPNPDLGPNDTTICLNETLSLRPGQFSSYIWQNSSTDSTFTVRAPGKYYVGVTDANGCRGSDTITVAYNPIPTVEVMFKGDTVKSRLTFCDGDGPQRLGSATSALSADYRWFRDGVIIPGATDSVLNAFNPSASVLYTLEITDLTLRETRCVVRDTARLLFNSDPVFNLPDTLIYCAPASPITSPLSGSSDISHRWITPVPDTVLDATVRPNVNGYHKLTTTNIVTGCTYSDSVWVIIHPRPAAVINVNPLGTCVGNRTILSANTAGHTRNVRYEWTGANSATIISTKTSVEVNTEQRYRLITVDDSTTCRDTAFFNLRYVDYPVIRGIDGNTIFCGPSVVLGNLLPLNMNYEWKRNGVTFSRDRLATLSQSGNYELTVTEPISGCFSKFTFIGTLTTPPLVNIRSQVTLCETDTLRISAFDPTHPLTTTYSWKRIDDGTIVDNDFVLDLDFKTHGNYTCYLYEASVRLTNTVNCVGRDTIRVCFERSPKANIIQNDTTICANNPLTLQAEGGKTYQWLSDSGIVNTTSTYMPPTSTTGLFKYTLVANNQNICPTTRDSISVRILPELSTRVQPPIDIIYCQDDTAQFAGFDPTHLGRNVTYTWSLLLAGQPNTVLQTGKDPNLRLPYNQNLEPYPLQIELLVQDKFCEYRDTAQVVYQPLDVVTLQQFNIPCAGGLARIGTQNPFSSSGPVRFVWETGEISPTIQVGESRYYYVDVTTGNCTYRDSIFVMLRGNSIKNLIDTALCFQPNLSLPDRNSYILTPRRHPFYFDHPDSIDRFILPSSSSDGKSFEVKVVGEYMSVLLSKLGPPCGSDTTIHKVREVCPALTFIPDIFTPNGDGLNDYFTVFGYHIFNFQMTIYDRWQNVVYKRRLEAVPDLSTLAEQEWWNGRRFNTGSPVSVGTYEWVISFEDKSTSEPVKSLRGYLILER